MNKQGELIDGKVVGGIEWTKWVNPDGTERQGFTWNPIAGCHHDCKWQMPDDSIAICYADSQASGEKMKPFYPNGFDHYYWHPKRLEEPLRVKTPSRIFTGSMTDVFGHWVPEDDILAVLDVIWKANWHTFQLLTKNPKRTREFSIASNAWIGASTPPDFMWKKPLNMAQKQRMLHATMSAFTGASGIHWLSAEPLSWDVSEILKDYPGVINWIVIGAASNGRTYYQPDPKHIEKLLALMDEWKVPVFFKGNLAPSLGKAFSAWREEFPR